MTTTAAPATTDTRLYIIAVLSLTAVQMLSTTAFNIAAILAPAAAPALGVAADDVAYYVSIVYLVSIYAAMAGGPMALRLGPIRLTQCGLTVSAIACLSLASGHIGLAALSAIILGLGGGPLTAASSQILSRVTPARLSNLTFSIKQSGVPLGYALAGALIPISVELHGWQAVAAAIAGICVITALALQPLRPLYDTAGATTGRLLPTFQQIVDPLKLAWADPVLRRLCLAAMFFSAMQATIVNFTVLYGVNGLLLDYVAAGILLSFATAAGMVGRVFWGALADATRRPLAMLVVLGGIMALGGFAMAAAQVGWPSWLLHGVAVVLGGTAIGWNGVFISECARRAPPGRAGEFVGATSFFVFLGPVIWPVLFRGILYATHSYAAGFAIMAVATGLSAISITWLLRRGER
ncbi:MFS transporter [Reyranella sp. CPCC 100927]|uniref:MFS transporter n=1 Tax=Reyranella sp. CPCC 100927 TaxID=2599616 RepID=UPI0011B83E27|nr:MFS transporter [Reyranella sp. CPCC 100927]TWT06057.1 MFS transporter [Reyranella sp. CPCC 100927]